MNRREYTAPYPRTVKYVEEMIRDEERANFDSDMRQDTRAFVRAILAAEYRARRPRYSLIRFLKAHR